MKNTFIKCVLILVLSVALGFGLLVLVWSLPLSGKKTEQNMEETAKIYRDEGTYLYNVSKNSPAPLIR